MSNLTTRNGRRLVGWPFSTLDLFDNMFASPPGSEVVWSASPSSLNIAHDDNGASITVDMPGVGAEDLELTVEDGVLEIAGKRGERTYRHRLALGDTLDPTTIEAHLDKGVLAVRVNKRAEAKPKKITVQVGSGPGGQK